MRICRILLGVAGIAMVLVGGVATEDPLRHRRSRRRHPETGARARDQPAISPRSGLVDGVSTELIAHRRNRLHRRAVLLA